MTNNKIQIPNNKIQITNDKIQITNDKYQMIGEGDRLLQPPYIYNGKLSQNNMYDEFIFKIFLVEKGIDRI
jgi:hypothetical protein